MIGLANQIWYGAHPLGAILAPLGWTYGIVSRLRRLAYQREWLPAVRLEAPVVVVGNICVGGTGKTPLVIALARYLRTHGYRPGIATRGYRGRAQSWPQAVTAESDPRQVGDEAVLLARSAGCPVAAGPDRVQAAQSLVQGGCNLVLCDDGLQHYRLARDVEIVMVDGERRHGNGRCLPAGPLREAVSRLRSVDLVITSGAPAPGEYSLRLRQGAPVMLAKPDVRRAWSDFVSAKVHAVAGIGHPQRFFSDLEAKGLIVQGHAFPDHHDFRASELRFADGLPVLMTEKDAVKCRSFAGDQHWYVPLDVDLPEAVGDRILELLKGGTYGQEAA